MGDYPYLLEKLCTVFKSEKHVKIVEIMERYFPRISNLAESKGNRLAKEKVMSDFLVNVNSPNCERRAMH